MLQKTELNRLELQARKHKDFDDKILQKIFNSYKKEINVLDVGCSNGYRTIERFKNVNVVKNVIGVDISKEAIDYARKFYSSNDKFKFLNLDVKKEDFIYSIYKTNISGFDLIYLSYTIHFLKDKKEILKKAYNLLNPNGTIFIRDLDDNAKLFYPDINQICEFAIDKTKSIPGQSDRESARKLYFITKQLGFSNIEMHYDVKDTLNTTIQERKEIFRENFSFRLNTLDSLLKQGKTQYQKDYNLLKNALENIEQLFLSNNFYYMEVNFVLTAKKNISNND